MPSTTTPTRSASAAASSKSCVTRSVGSAVSRRNSCELSAHRRTGARVEGRQRLVEQQHLRLSGERPRERDPLALTSRELRRPHTGEVLDAATARGAQRRGRCRRTRRSRARSSAGRARTPGTRAPPTAAREADRSPPWCRATLCAEGDPSRRPAEQPAIARSTVDLPAPDGPTIATVSPLPTSSASARSKERRRRGDVDRERVHTGISLDGQKHG